MLIYPFRYRQPVSIAVSPDLSDGLPFKNATIPENDSGPILLIVSDVGVNGPFVTAAEGSLVSAGVHWETVRYGKTMPKWVPPYRNLPELSHLD